MEHSKEYNRRLCEKYPFLIPTNRFSGKRITEGAGFWPGSPDSIPNWDYESTELDDMPEGWRIAFGEQLCAELKALLLVLKELLHDKYEYIEWWLYDAGDYVVENVDGSQKWDLTDPGALYDYLIETAE